MNRPKLIFAFCLFILAFASLWMLVTTPAPYKNVEAFSAGDFQAGASNADKVRRDIDKVLSSGVNPFALPAEVSAVAIETPNSDSNPNNPANPANPVKPGGEKPPPPPPPATDTHDPDKPKNGKITPPPKYKWPVNFRGIFTHGAKRFVHLGTDKGKPVMAYEGDTIELANDKGDMEKVTIVEITSDRIRVRNQEGLEADLSYDRLKFKGTVFPEEKENPFEVPDEDAVKESIQKK
jgi:hypothetical protein